VRIRRVLRESVARWIVNPAAGDGSVELTAAIAVKAEKYDADEDTCRDNDYGDDSRTDHKEEHGVHISSALGVTRVRVRMCARVCGGTCVGRMYVRYGGVWEVNGRRAGRGARLCVWCHCRGVCERGTRAVL